MRLPLTWVPSRSYAMHFADITVSDLVLVNEDAEVVQGDHAVNAAGFSIHSEIHKAHPWINAVCHAHVRFFLYTGYYLQLLTVP